MSEATKLNPLTRGAKFELRMFVNPSSQYGTVRTTQPEKKALSSPRTQGRQYLIREVSQGSITKIEQLSLMSRVLFKQVIDYNNSLEGKKSILDSLLNDDLSSFFYYRTQADEAAGKRMTKI
jgi:hypothetical protein